MSTLGKSAQGARLQSIWKIKPDLLRRVGATTMYVTQFGFGGAGLGSVFLFFAGRYTLLHQDALERLLPLCLSKGIRIIAGSPFQSGILATGNPPDTKYNYRPPPPRILARMRRLEEICDVHSVSLPAAALQFPLGHPAVVSVIPGASSADKVIANLQFFQASIPNAFWQALRDAKLIDARAPLPRAIVGENTNGA